MKQKIFCPHCNRCLGECVVSDSSGDLKVLKHNPEIKAEKHLLHDMKCTRCKEQVYILMQFND